LSSSRRCHRQRSNRHNRQQTQQQQQQQQKKVSDVFADIPASEVAAMASELSDDEPTVDKTAFELPTLEI
jgi:transcription initiation factor TFIID subunit TAF12